LVALNDSWKQFFSPVTSVTSALGLMRFSNEMRCINLYVLLNFYLFTHLRRIDSAIVDPVIAARSETQPCLRSASNRRDAKTPATTDGRTDGHIVWTDIQQVSCRVSNGGRPLIVDKRRRRRRSCEYRLMLDCAAVEFVTSSRSTWHRPPRQWSRRRTFPLLFPDNAATDAADFSYRTCCTRCTVVIRSIPRSTTSI